MQAFFHIHADYIVRVLFQSGARHDSCCVARNVGQPLPRESPTNVLFDVFCPLLFDTRVIQASLVFQERLDRRCVFTTLFVVVVAFNLQELLTKTKAPKHNQMQMSLIVVTSIRVNLLVIILRRRYINSNLIWWRAFGDTRAV